MSRTRAGMALARAVKSGPKQLITASNLAMRLGVTSPSVWAWRHFHARPTHHLRQAIERILGIPVDDWMTAAERKVACVERVERKAG